MEEDNSVKLIIREMRINYYHLFLVECLGLYGYHSSKTNTYRHYQVEESKVTLFVEQLRRNQKEKSDEVTTGDSALQRKELNHY